MSLIGIYASVLGAGGSPPVNTAAPVITGADNIGQTLTCSTGSWNGSPTSYAYQWNRSGTPIGGATSSTYTLQSADDQQTITCTVTATNVSGSASATSAGVAIVGSVFINDSYTDTDGTLLTAHTPELGGAITKHPSFSGSLAIDATHGMARGNTTTSALNIYGGAPTTTDYDVEADLIGYGTIVTSTNQVGVVGRWSATAATGFMAEFNKSGGYLTLFQYSAGSTTNLGNYSTSLGTTSVHLKLSFRGSTVTVYWNGVARLTGTDSSPTIGVAGVFRNVGTADTDANGYRIDNFLATNA